MSKRMILSGLLVPISLLWGIGEEGNGMRLISPKPMSIHHEEMASVVVALTSADVEKIVISAESNQSYTLPREKGRGTYCKTVRLIPGENTISVSMIFKGGKHTKQSLELFHDIVSEKIYKYPPETFTLNDFHVSQNEQNCIPCHKMEINEIPGVAFDNSTESNCFPCHEKLTTRGQGHAPAVNFLCTSCHKTAQMLGKEENGSADAPKFRLAKKVGEECLLCHKKERELWEEKRFHHMPVDAARCTRCHNPHSSEHKYYLKAKPWDLCTSCHIDKRDGNHFINTFSRKDHPTKGKPDPSRPGKELECISCHTPHASDTQSLIDGKSPMSICQKCHKK